MMNHADFAFDQGVAMALRTHGVAPDEFVKMAAMLDRLNSSESEPYGRLCAQLGRDIYEKAGRTDTTGFHLFDRLTKMANWCPEAQKLAVEPLHRALGDMRVKCASVDAISNVAGAAVKASPAALKYLYMLAALTGVGAGTAAWSVERDSKQDNEAVEADKARTDAYNQMSYLLDNGIR